jgi:xanthine/uracil permease
MIRQHPVQTADGHSVDGRSLGELFADLLKEIRTLLQQEWRLARTELSQKAARAGKDIGLLAVGGAIVYAGFLALLATAIIALAIVLPWWLAALIVGVVVCAIGAGLIWVGISGLRGDDLVLEQTTASLREDAQWVKRET